MKRLIYGLAFMRMIQICSCQQIPEKEYNYHIVVKDEEGKPVHNANVRAKKHILVPTVSPVPAAKPVNVNVLTDRDGVASISFGSVQTPGGVAIEKYGYYSTREQVEWIMPDGFEGKSRNAEVQAILKPVKNPIPMIASMKTDRIWIRELGVAFGYDLVENSPLPPLGNGKHADFMITVMGEYKDMLSNELKMNLIFQNPDDGVVEFITPQRLSMTEPIMEGSELISGYEAPVDGYINSITRHSVKQLDEAMKKVDSDHRRNFYFRVRTRKNERGKVTSAFYGKIYGDFYFVSGNFSKKGNYASLSWIATYLNPTQNDRNVEFDPNRNLNPNGNVQSP